MSISNGMHLHNPLIPRVMVQHLPSGDRPYFAFAARLAQHNHAVAQMRQCSYAIQKIERQNRAQQAKEGGR